MAQPRSAECAVPGGGHLRVLYVLIVVCCLCAWRSPVQALETFATNIPNRVYALNSEGVRKPCITCHNNPDGGTGCENTGGTKPCLNPFGTAFRHLDTPGAQDRTWTAVLAALDSDGDGFSNAQELQVLRGTWTIINDQPGKEDYVTAPGDPARRPGINDKDGDRHCIVGFDTNKDGDCLDPEENNGLFDCDDADALAFSNQEKENCQRSADSDCDGRIGLDDSDCADVADQDRDGYCKSGRDTNGDADCLDPGEAGAGSDCNDKQLTVNSGASENCFDQLDNDCDTRVDALDTDSCTGDTDGDRDGFCAVGTDSNGDHDCKDSGEQTATGDCDDRNAAVKPAAKELTCRDGLDNDCDTRADLTDSDCASVADRDGDAHCPTGADLNKDGDCLDDKEQSPDQADCNDADPKRSRGLKEDCVDRVDNDCDDLVDTADNVGGAGDCKDYVDADKDGYCAAGEDFIVPRNGLCIDPGETRGFNDCAENNMSASPIGKEICADAVDNDCDGSSDAFDSECRAFRDADRDGFCHAGHDDNDDGDCSDAAEQGTPNEASCPTQGGVDPDTRPTVHPGGFEHCRDNLDNNCNGAVDQNDVYCMSTADKDGDGYCPLGKDLSSPPDGDCADLDERTAQSDCNDDDATIGPQATDDCRDRLDNNCDTKVDLEDEDCGFLFDRDGDGFCGKGFDSSGDGDCLDAAEDSEAADCLDSNGAVFPGSREICDDGLDNDCDARTDAADETCPCEADVQCEDGDPCTMGSCRGMVCQYTPVCTNDAGAEPMAEPEEPETEIDAAVSVADAGIDEAAAEKKSSSSCALSPEPGAGPHHALWMTFAMAALWWRRRGF